VKLANRLAINHKNDANGFVNGFIAFIADDSSGCQFGLPARKFEEVWASVGDQHGYVKKAGAR
jgi:hypothetical protein